MAPPDRRTRQRLLVAGGLTAVVAALAFSIVAHGEPASAVKATRPVVAAESGERWHDLTTAQKQFLQPLEHDWARLELQQKRKWLMLTTRVPKMSADERQRIQARMTEWATLTPEQRGAARLRYQEAKQVPASDRQARWDAYQSLSPELRQQLAARASQSPDGNRRSAPASAPSSTRAERPMRDPVAKSNIVPNPAFAASPKPIGPALVQAMPGATTTLISKRATPPVHQQSGLPKIAATPEFVNKETLLPQRSPQGAAGRPALAASGADAARRQ